MKLAIEVSLMLTNAYIWLGNLKILCQLVGII